MRFGGLIRNALFQNFHGDAKMTMKKKMQHAFSETIQVAIMGVDKIPGVRPNPQSILVDIKKIAGRKPGSIEEIINSGFAIEDLDECARRHINRSTALAAGTGAISGLGAIGIAASVSGLLGSTVGLCHRLALTYGFDDMLEPGNEKLVLFGLGAAVGVDVLAMPAITVASTIGVGSGVLIFGNAAPQAALIASQLVANGVIPRALAPAFANELLKRGAVRLAGQLLPIIGAVVGTAANGAFLRIWGKRIKEFYRDQHLKARSAHSRIASDDGASPE
jgi:hypothetical protein